MTSDANNEQKTLTPIGAAAYYQWLQDCLDGISGDLPAISASADMAAECFVCRDYPLVLQGDGGFRQEASGRAGGLMALQSTPAPGQCAVVLSALREEHLEEDALVLAQYGAGSVLIPFARAELLRQAAQGGMDVRLAVVNHATEHGGLFPCAEHWLVPTDPTANNVALWAWSGEFIAACTQRGKMPVIWQSLRAPGALERNNLQKGKRFTEQVPPPIPSGECGTRFLDELRQLLTQVYREELGHIIAVAQGAWAARKAGQRCYVSELTHTLARRMGCPHDPGYFLDLPRKYSGPDPDKPISPGDFFFGVSYDKVYRGEEFGNRAERLRQAGAVLAWSLTDYYPEEIAAIPPEEILINQHWGFGDAVVPVPGYDVQICPVSGVIAEAILWMVNAEMLKMELCACPPSATRRRWQTG